MTNVMVDLDVMVNVPLVMAVNRNGLCQTSTSTRKSGA
jgi:hypothetical protein